MKHSIKFGLMGGMILFCLSMSLTSCEDILGEWSRPTPNPVTPGGGGSSTINATAITLKQTMKVLVKGGDALTITATATPAEATLTWESSDPTIATVENGVVTPKALGIATITAKSGDVKATCEVFVGNEVDLGAAAYPAKNYDILKGNMGANSLTIPDGFKVAFNGVQTTEQIICSGDATIYLADGSENEVTAPYSSYKAGIQIGGTGTTLTINGETAGTGTLTAKGGYQAAGIGTNKDETGGNIVINGGRVTATGGGYAAGIGTGRNGSGTLSGGNIVINGGTVTAKGGSDGAGIGTGRANAGSITCGDITINGGRVTATGGDNGAGIGTGNANASTSQNTCGAITINGGTVIATGGKFGAGIGTGNADYATSTNKCGAITIDAGVTSVTATKGTSSPNSIGQGYNHSSSTQTCGTITIGGTVYWESNAYVGTGGTYLTNDITYPEP